MSEDEKWLRAYFFWSWQYTSRNTLFINSLRKVRLVLESLTEKGFLNCRDSTRGQATLYDVAYPSGVWIKCGSTSKYIRSSGELGGLTRYLHDTANIEYEKHLMVEECNVSLDEIKEIVPSEKEKEAIRLFLDAHNAVMKRGYSPWYADEPSVSSQNLLESYPIDYETCKPPARTSDLPIEAKGRLPNGRHLIEIDLSAPIRILNSGIESIKSISEDDSSDGFYSFMKKSIKNKEEVSFEIKRDKSRVLGLWLYDYCESSNCGSPTAINKLLEEPAVKENPEFSYLLDDEINIDNTQRKLRHILNKTAKCIENCEVLTIG